VQGIEDIACELSSGKPEEIRDAGARRAAVAMMLRETAEGPEVFFIERARYEGDPWSGHMAFPGGRVESADTSIRAAAERETLEEVGISLSVARCLGRLDDKSGNPRTDPRLVISAWVYALEEVGEPSLNHEVQQAFWFPLAGLLDPLRHVPHPVGEAGMEFPGILVGEAGRHVVWGLTYSFLESFFVAVGRPLPDRWQPELRAYSRGTHEGER